MIDYWLPALRAEKHFSPAFRRLLGLLWLSFGHSPPEVFNPVLLAGSDSQDAELSTLAVGHGVIHWLLRHLDGPERYLSPKLLDAWRKHDRDNKMQSMLHCMWISRLTQALQKAGIPCLPIKGVCAALRYHGDASARACGDIDLMVTPDDLEQAQAIFLTHGLEQTFPATKLNPAEMRWVKRNMHHLTFRESASTILIELHWALHDNNLLENEDRNWARLADSSLKIGATSVLALDPVRDYLLLLTHAARSVWGRIKWLLDLELASRALKEADRAEVQQSIRRLQLQPAQQMFLELSSVLFGNESEKLPSRLPTELRFLLAEAKTPSLWMKLLDVRTLYRLRNSSSYRWDTFRLRAVSWKDIELLGLPAYAFPLYGPLRLPMLVYRNLTKSRRDC